MTQRMKTTLRAPDDVTESVIDGTPYFPEDDGTVATTNPGHVRQLVLHGYTVVSEQAITAPARTAGPIDTDELGKSQLQAALTERGVMYPAEATRGELVDIAESWNNARQRRLRGGAPTAVPAEPGKTAAEAPAPAPATQAPAEPAAAAQATETGLSAGVQGQADFGEASYDDLKGWLAAHGVAYPANTPKKKLREMAEEAFAALKTAKAA